METLAEKEERSDRYTLRSVGFFYLRHNLSAALSLERCLRRTSDSQGAEGVVRAGLEDKGQTVSIQDVRVEQKVSVALLASRDANCLGGGSEDETIADSREDESEHRFTSKDDMWRGIQFNSIHVYLYSAFYDTIVAKHSTGN